MSKTDLLTHTPWIVTLSHVAPSLLKNNTSDNSALSLESPFDRTSWTKMSYFTCRWSFYKLVLLFRGGLVSIHSIYDELRGRTLQDDDFDEAGYEKHDEEDELFDIQQVRSQINQVYFFHIHERSFTTPLFMGT